MNIQPRRHSHFEGLHIGSTSSFGCAFPVPNDIEAVNASLASLPSLIDKTFALRGSANTYETNAKSGAIPLRPASTKLAIERLSDVERSRIVRGRHFVFQSLTEGIDLQTAQLRLDGESDKIEDVSLVCQGYDSGKPVNIELRAVLNNPYEDTYEVVTYRDGVEHDSILIDDAAAGEFVHALRETQAGKELPALTKDDGFLDILNGSPDYTHTQTGSYILPGEKDGSLKLERTQRVVKKISHLTFMKLTLESKSSTELFETVRQFRLSFDGNGESAHLSYMVQSLDGGTSAEKRADMFDALSVFLRENPHVLFGALSQSVEDLTKLD